MRLFSTFFTLYLVVACGAQWSYDTSSSASGQCTDGNTIPLGDCSSHFQRCRCNKWITSLCPDSSIFNPVTQLCIFDDGTCTTTTAAPVYPSVTSTPAPLQYTTMGYTDAPPQYSTESSYTSLGYTTTAPEYPSEVSSTVVYTTPAPEYPSEVPSTAVYTTRAPNYPTDSYLTPDYTPSAAPQYPTSGYPTAPQSPTEAYPSPGYPTNAAPQAPTDAYPTQNAPVSPTRYPAQEPSYNSAFTVQVQQHGLSNPFFVPRRFNRHYHRDHGYGRDGEIRVGKLPGRSRSPVIDYRHHDVSDVFRAPDSRGIFSNDWDVFSRSRVHKKKHRKHHDDEDKGHKDLGDEDDDDIESIGVIDIKPDPANLSAPSESNGDFLTSMLPASDEDDNIVTMDEDGSGSADDTLTTMSPPVVRRKRSYLPVIEDKPSRCAGTADNSIFSLGVCHEYFIICRKSKELTAACPVGDLFDFETARCVPSNLCGVVNAEICPSEDLPDYTLPITTTQAPALPAESTPVYPEESAASLSPGYPVESTTRKQLVYTTTSASVYATQSSSAYRSVATTIPYETSRPSAETIPPVYTLPMTTTSHPIEGQYYQKEMSSHLYQASHSSDFLETATEVSAPVITTTVGEPYYFVPTSRATEKPEVFIPPNSVDTMIPTRGKTSAPIRKFIYVNVSSDSENFCVGLGDSLYRDPNDCSGIVQCHGGEMFQHISCPSGLVFNNDKQQCDYKNQVSECDLPAQNPAAQTGCRGAQHGGYLPDEADCTIFHRCVWDRLERMSCPAGTVFNPTLSVCDWPANVLSCPSSSDETRPSSPY